MQRCPSPTRQGKDPLRRRTPNPLLPPRGRRCLARVQRAEADEGASRLTPHYFLFSGRTENASNSGGTLRIPRRVALLTAYHRLRCMR
jgi:hypothetical protein